MSAVHKQGYPKTYPLHKVVQYCNVAKLEILLGSRDINEINDKGYPLIVLACEQEKNEKILEVLFRCEGIDPTLTNNDKFNALHILALKGNLLWIQKLLEKFPEIPIEAVTENGNTALILAAKMNHDDVIQYLYDKGSYIRDIVWAINDNSYQHCL